MENYAELMFQGVVAELQKADGSFDKFQTAYPHRTQKELSPDDIDFLRSRESFYIASISTGGWPYIQHRGGPAGFVHVIGPARIACADYRGNRQFITMGNLQIETRVSLFFMDYLRRARLKIQGQATLEKIEDADPDLVLKLNSEELPVERILVIDIVGLDWNCPKYIPTLYSEVALRQIIGPEIVKLKTENETLKKELATLREQREPEN
ncbi:MAG: pyridoxamine 5'-phosphate oxidase family protein [Methyloligellaceae bacterium]